MNFDNPPEHIKKRHEKGIPQIGKLDDAVLPGATFTYTEVEILAPEHKLAPVLDNSSKLDSLTQKAMDFLDEVLSEPMAVDDTKMVAIQMDAARTVLTTQLRVDDSRLKKRQTDTLAELLKRMDQEDARLQQIA